MDVWFLATKENPSVVALDSNSSWFISLYAPPPKMEDAFENTGLDYKNYYFWKFRRIYKVRQ